MSAKLSGEKVTVVVVNWNRRELLDSALRSLQRQTVPAIVVVVDNGSTDGSVDLAAVYPATRWILNRRNLGFCAANNQAIHLADTEFVALLNNDAEAEPEWLEALLRCFLSPAVGMAASKILVWGSAGQIDKVGHSIYPDGQNRGRGTGQLDSGQFDLEEDVLWPDGCAAMYRKTMLDEIGGFDEDLFAYGDDAELGLRARIAGWTCRYAPKAVVRHHRGTTLGKGSIRRLALIERNRVLLAVRHFPWSLLVLNPYYYALRLWTGVWAASRGDGETASFPGFAGKLRLAAGLLRGDLEAILLLPKTLWKRWTSRVPKKMKSAEVRALILENRISLAEMHGKAALK